MTVPLILGTAPCRNKVTHAPGDACRPPVEWKRPCPNGTHGGVVVTYGHSQELEGPCELCDGEGTITTPLTCQKCGGAGYLTTATDAVMPADRLKPWMDQSRHRCPDCVKGAPIIDWPVPCPVLAFEGPEVHDDHAVNPCPRCGRQGFITVPHTVRAVPILDSPEKGYPPFPRPERFVLISRAKTPALRLVDDIAKTDTYHGPADTAKPGDYVIIATPTTTKEKTS